MTTSETSDVDPRNPHGEPSFIDAHRDEGLGAYIKSWLITVDHKRIGIMYLVSVLFFFMVGGFFALLVRTELLTPTKTIVDAHTYNQFFTIHGTVMVFMVIVPGIPAALGNIVLPLQLGAKDVAFPKLNLMSLYIFWTGALLAISAIVFGGVDTGWTFYTPYSTTTDGQVILMTFAVFVLGFSSIFTGMNFVVTIHKMRAPGMSWFRLPLFLWGVYSTSIIQIMATPVLAITLLLLIMERAVGIGIFRPDLGGDPVLFQHFFWFYSHPAVYIMILPGLAVTSDLVAVMSQKKIFGYSFVAFSSLSIAIISFIVWGHHMFLSGQSEVAAMVFSFLTFLVAIPTAVKIFNWVATMYKGSIAWTTPMFYTFGFLFQFMIGGLTGLFLGTLSVDVHLHDTYFVVAHFHYVMMGGTMFAFMGGLYYWWPKFTGRMFNDTIGKLAATFVFVGFNVTFFSQFMMGSQGMPRRYYNYIEYFQTWHVSSTIGAYILGIGFTISAVTLALSLFSGKKAPDNPWGAKTLEWTHTATPPIEHNFHEQPICTHGPYDFDEGEH